MTGQDNTFQRLMEVVAETIGDGDAPVVVYSALWPLAKVTLIPADALARKIIGDLLHRLGPKRSLLMPSFTRGFTDGFIDLDTAPSVTGLLSESFRRYRGSRRSVSAFFSYAVQGPDADDVIARRPRDAWGDGSLFHWMEQRDVRFLMLGTHPTHCSYLHRVEWLAREKIDYRMLKTFSGTARHEGRDIALEENLFVRSLDPEPVNDFTSVLPVLEANGLRVEHFGGVRISAMNAQAMRDAFLPALLADPHMVLVNRHVFQSKG